MITLYELAGADPGLRFSPYCWRVVMALAHKGLPFVGVPVPFTAKQTIAFSGQDKVPVLQDGDRTVCDSWAIALHLEEAYPDRPALFGGAQGRGVARFVQAWSERVVHAGILPLIVTDIPARLAPADARYFRETREARLGKTLEAFAGDPAPKRAALHAGLSPLRATLAAQPFLAGDAPAYPDYLVFGAFQWARLVSPRDVLEGTDAVSAWRDRMLDLHDGLARRALPPRPGPVEAPA